MGDDILVPGNAAAGLERWYVAHTRPRCEKKLFEYCQRERIAVTLLCFPSAHKYRGKTVVFQKPLFPGYVFLQVPRDVCSLVRQNEHVVKLLEVADQGTLERQLSKIRHALDAGLAVRLAPTIGMGMRVRVKLGPLRGVEGWVEQRRGLDTVLLRLDFINQAAMVRLGAEALELV